MKRINCFVSIVLLCCITTASCSQTTVFAGSTSCNPAVNAILKIPATDTCVYMKWDLTIFTGNNRQQTYKLHIGYGDYLPNTMYFLGGGKSTTITGKLTTSTVTRNTSRYTVYHLVSDKMSTELLFMAMDDNILHLIDNNKNLVKGDASFGFALNRLPAQ